MGTPSNTAPTIFNKTYNLHIHTPMYDGRYFKGLLKIADKHYIAMKSDVGGAESGSCGMGVKSVMRSGNAKTNTESSIETMFTTVINEVTSFSKNGTRLIFRGTKGNLVCNRVPAL
jgi:hypothetical protein